VKAISIKQFIQKRSFFGIVLISLFLIVPLEVTTSEEPEIFFNLDLLAPNSCGLNIYGIIVNTLMEELVKIGIGINDTDFTGWANIAPRTWAYPGPYPIPTYDEGGYDVFFVGWAWWLSWNPNEVFNSSLTPPHGDNFYQYVNPVMDSALGNYSKAITFNDRFLWAKKIQSILYEDLPQITLFYPKEIYLHNAALEGWDSTNWLIAKQSMENWSIPGQTTFSYALPTDFGDFFPLTESYYDDLWLHQIYNGLLTQNPLMNNYFAPRIASSYSSVDGLTYTIQINPNAVWADGVTLNASDVEFTYKLMLTPEFDNLAYKYWVKYLTNDSITIKNEFELTITFNQSCVFPEDYLTLPLVPKHIWEGIPYSDIPAQAKEWAVNSSSKIIGAGPYMLAEYNKNENFIHLTKNPHFKDWFGSEPKFNDIYFRFFSSKEEALNALASGEIDMVDTQFRISLDEIPPGVSYTLANTDSYSEMAINNYHPIIGTGENCPIAGKQSAKYVRRAINHIIPREVIKNAWEYYFLEDGTVPCPRSSPFFDDSFEPFEYNLTKAKHYMELAGYEYLPSPSYIISIGLEIIPILALLGAAIVIAVRSRKTRI